MTMVMRSLFALVIGLVAVQAGGAESPQSPGGSGSESRPDFSGVWLVEKPQGELKTVAGKAPPLQPEAAALYSKRKQARASGKSADDPVAACLPQGIPRLLSTPQPIHILQKPKQITVLYQANHQARLFYIGDPIPPPEEAPDVTYNGTSYARWEGKAFVVETLTFNDQTWLDDAGLPHSEALRVIERYQLADPSHLRVTVTITDPQTFTAPWETQVIYKKEPGLRLREDACAEKLWNPGAPPSG